MRCFLVMMDETRRVILDSGGQGGDERVGEGRGGSGDFFWWRRARVALLWFEVTCFGRLWEHSSRPSVVCVFCAHNDAVVCVVR